MTGYVDARVVVDEDTGRAHVPSGAFEPYDEYDLEGVQCCNCGHGDFRIERGPVNELRAVDTQDGYPALHYGPSHA